MSIHEKKSLEQLYFSNFYKRENQWCGQGCSASPALTTTHSTTTVIDPGRGGEQEEGGGGEGAKGMVTPGAPETIMSVVANTPWPHHLPTLQREGGVFVKCSLSNIVFLFSFLLSLSSLLIAKPFQDTGTLQVKPNTLHFCLFCWITPVHLY